MGKTTKNNITKKQMDVRKSKGMSIAKDFHMLTSKGNPAKDQKIRVWTSANGEQHTREFLSYDSLIANKYDNRIILDSNLWNFSRTTTKYLSQFLNQNLKQIRKSIRNGDYKLLDLN